MRWLAEGESGEAPMLSSSVTCRRRPSFPSDRTHLTRRIKRRWDRERAGESSVSRLGGGRDTCAWTFGEALEDERALDERARARRWGRFFDPLRGSSCMRRRQPDDRHSLQTDSYVSTERVGMPLTRRITSPTRSLPSCRPASVRRRRTIPLLSPEVWYVCAGCEAQTRTDGSGTREEEEEEEEDEERRGPS